MTPDGKRARFGETDPCLMATPPDIEYADIAAFGPSPIVKVTPEKSRRGVNSSFRIGSDGALESLDPRAAQVGAGRSGIGVAGDGSSTPSTASSTRLEAARSAATAA